jgi:hypothetical protein
MRQRHNPDMLTAAFYDELHEAYDERAAAASQLWGYFEGEPRGHYDGPERLCAEELAAWRFLGWGKARRDQLHLP